VLTSAAALRGRAGHSGDRGARVREVIHRAGFPLDSYSGQKMLGGHPELPRPERSPPTPESLYETTTGVLAVGRPAQAAGCSCAATRNRRSSPASSNLPRDRYTTTTRLASAGGVAGRARRHHLEVQRPGRRDRDRQGALHGAHRSGRQADPDSGANPAAARDAVRSWDDLMVEAVLAEWRARTSRRLPGHLRDRVGAGTGGSPSRFRRPTGGLHRRGGLVDLRRAFQTLPADGDLDTSCLPPADPEPGGAAVQAVPGRFPRDAVAGSAGVAAGWASRWSTSGPTRCAATTGPSAGSFGLRAAHRPAVLADVSTDGTALRTRFPEAFAAAWQVQRRGGRYQRTGPAPAASAGVSDGAPHLRQVTAPGRQPYSQDSIENAVLGPHRRGRPRWSRLVRDPVQPGAGGRTTGARAPRR